MFHAVSVPVAVHPKSTEVPVTLVAVKDEGAVQEGGGLQAKSYTKVVPNPLPSDST